MTTSTGPAGAATLGRWDGIERWALAVIAALTVARFVLAPIVPLAFDEAYYWRWSEHLAFGYLDHPPLVAWMIRAGTTLFGDTHLGVRFLPLVGGVAATWAVWRTAALLFEDRRIAALAALYFNVTLILAVGTILATPDSPLLVAAAFVLFFLAKAARTGQAGWWLAAGVAVGVGCLAKYTALFWFPSIFLWLLLDPRMRPVLGTPAPWLGAALGLVVFLPNVLWNGANEWMSFTYQFGRVDDGNGFAPGYLVEHFGTEIGMATPIVFLLAWSGLALFLRARDASRTPWLLLGAFVWPMSLYFIVHALRARVEGNWTGPIYPAIAIAAAAVATLEWRGFWGRFLAAVQPFAIPVGLVLVIAIYVQTVSGILPLGSWDPTASRMGAGIAAVTVEIEEVRQAEGATLILAPDYGLTGWLSFYQPTQPAPVAELGEPNRWLQEPPLTDEARSGPYLLILPAGEGEAEIETPYGTAIRIHTIDRTRGDLLISRYDIYRIDRRVLAGG
ncbi:MAG: glycosyltransferase family 39 protein [Bauldia sp.]|nr:glycosyltransferase family 39 protein [Bauldia sp.]